MNITFPKLDSVFDAAPLQKWIDQMRDAFANRISVAKNLDAELVDIDFVAGSTPQKRIAATVEPVAVWLCKVRQIEPASNTPPTIPDAFSWRYADGSIFIPSLGSIAGSAKHRVTVLVVRS